jgi:hypothetical protein
MEMLAFIAFAVLVCAWMAAPSARNAESIRADPRVAAEAGT